MPKFYVELDARVYFEGEIEADNEEDALDIAFEQADDELGWEKPDWDVSYIGPVEEEEN